MIYSELLSAIKENDDLMIKRNMYSDNFFGNFLIEFFYKKKIRIRIVNDRGKIELFVIFFHLEIPFDFVVKYVQKKDCINYIYIFDRLEDAYELFSNNKYVLDKIIEEKTRWKIIKKYCKRKRNCFQCSIY